MTRILSIGVGVHKLIEERLKQGESVKRRDMTAAEQEAVKLRKDAKWKERNDWVAKKITDDQLEKWHPDLDDKMAELPSVNDLSVEHFLMPMVDQQLNTPGSSLTGYSIMEEIHEDRVMGKLHPFVEGEPIGACNNRRSDDRLRNA